MKPGKDLDAVAPRRCCVLHYIEGASVRLIAKKMGLARKTVRKILGRHRARGPKPAAETRS